MGFRNSWRSIALAPSTGTDPLDSRSLRRRLCCNSSYRATNADTAAWESGLRPQPCALALNGKLRNIVARKLSLDWSPEQVAGWLKLQYCVCPTKPSIAACLSKRAAC